MTLKGGLIGVVVVAIILYFADWAFYMKLMPTPDDLKAQMGALIYTEETMPNPLWYLVMEITVAGVLAFGVLQQALTTSQAAQRGALIFAAVTAIVGINFGMTLNIEYPLSMIATEMIYKLVIGGVSGVVMVMTAKKFS